MARRVDSRTASRPNLFVWLGWAHGSLAFWTSRKVIQVVLPSSVCRVMDWRRCYAFDTNTEWWRPKAAVTNEAAQLDFKQILGVPNTDGASDATPDPCLMCNGKSGDPRTFVVHDLTGHKLCGSCIRFSLCDKLLFSGLSPRESAIWNSALDCILWSASVCPYDGEDADVLRVIR